MIYYKYPRTPHLPFSASITNDDRTLESDGHFYKMDKVVVSIKMDGENTTVYKNGSCHARSIDSKHREYHSWLIRDIQNWYYKLPDKHYRVCGEYMYAQHSIAYNNLSSYFQAFSIWRDDICLSWKETLEMCESLGITTVPVVYVGEYNTRKIEELAQRAVYDGQEGIVVRNYDAFSLDDFDKNIAKYVRPHHVSTDEHWSQKTIIPNKLEKRGK